MITQFLILDHMPNGAFVLRQDLTVRFWNSRLEEWTGILRQQIIGRPITEHFPHLATPKYAMQLEQVFRNGIPLIFSPHLHKYIIPVTLARNQPQIQTTTVTRLPGEEGAEQYLLFSIQDVTELALRIKDYRAMRDQARREVKDRKQAEKALQHINMHLENIFNAAIPLCVTLKNFDISQVNDAYCSLFGVEMHDTFGRKCYESRPGPACHTAECPMQSIKNGAEQVEFEMLKIRQDGSSLYCIVTAKPYRDVNGELLGIVENFQNISKRKQAEEALYDAREAAEQANKAKSRFLANMSHELRTPFNAILGFAHLLERDVRQGSEQQRHLDIIIRSGEHLLTLINQVLDFSKIEAGKMALHPQNIDLHHLLHEVIDLFTLEAKRKNIQLVFDCSPDVPHSVRIDQIKLRQVLINLLSNAFKFTQEGGVTLRVSRLPGETGQSSSIQLRFSVEDTGPGIAQDELTLIFDAFTQATAGQTQQHGTGLGLAISQRFARLLQGDLVVRSKIHQGTTFVFSLPVETVDADDVPRGSPAQRILALAPDQPPYKILLVDENTENRQLLVKLLHPLGFTLREARDGQEAVEMWAAWTPHAVLMDVYMTGMNGYDATRQIREAERARHKAEGGNHSLPAQTVIIALTASVLEEERAAFEAGCDAFLRKPFKPSEIFDALHQYMGVRYVYEGLTRSSKQEEPLSNDADITQAITMLRPEVIARLRTAALTTNVTLLTELCHEIRQENPVLADALLHLTNNFDYTTLIKLLHK